MKSIEYSLVLSKRKTIAIIVKPDQSVEVRAPKRVSTREVEAFLQQKQSWVLAKLNDFSSRPEPHRPEYKAGATHFFLGEPHRLIEKLSAAPMQQLGLALAPEEDEVIALTGISQATPAQVERKLDQWYRAEALALFTERHEYWREQMADYRLPPSHVAIRKMKRRWGSCTTKGKITFNTALAKYPLECVDSVVVHELCHLLEFSHNKRFYGFMDAVFPAWKQADKRLQTLHWEY